VGGAQARIVKGFNQQGTAGNASCVWTRQASLGSCAGRWIPMSSNRRDFKKATIPT